MHCHGNSLSLSIRDLTSTYKILRGTIGTLGEINVLVKYSPRDKILGAFRENIEREIAADGMGSRSISNGMV